MDNRQTKDSKITTSSPPYQFDTKLDQTVDRLFEDAERKNKKIQNMKMEYAKKII